MINRSVVFVTGANRGLGLEFVRQLGNLGYAIIAGYRERERSAELLELIEEGEDLSACKVDVTEEADIRSLRDYIAERFGRLDLLINNAGINLEYSTSIDDIEAADVLDNFRVNVIGPFLTARILRPLLTKGTRPKIINISSTMGSIERSSGGATPYRISKAAVNMLSKNQALAYKDNGIIVLALNPGWVKTDMGGPDAPLDPMESVSNMIKVIEGLTIDNSGTFLGHDGLPRPY